MRTIGLIGGMSWQSSKIYYERINQLVADRRGGATSAQLIVNSLDFAPIARMQSEGRWKEAGAVLANAAQSLERAGADVIAIGANTSDLRCPDGADCNAGTVYVYAAP